jgi:hypothetical protein
VFFAFDSVKSRFYVFEPNTLQSIAADAIARKPATTQELITMIVGNLSRVYPGHVNTEQVSSFP